MLKRVFECGMIVFDPKMTFLGLKNPKPPPPRRQNIAQGGGVYIFIFFPLIKRDWALRGPHERGPGGPTCLNVKILQHHFSPKRIHANKSWPAGMFYVKVFW